MKTIAAALLAHQKSPNAHALARASLADNGALHLAQQFTDTWSGGYTRTANCTPAVGASFFIRVRTVLVGAKLQYQKITDPTVESQWKTWADLDTNVANVLAFGLFWTGTYAVAVYQDASDLHLKYRRTTDGVTWSAEANAYTTVAPNPARLWPADGGASHSGLFVSHGSQVYWGGYNPAADTWTALSSAGLSLTSSVAEGDAFYDSANGRHVCVCAPNGLFSYSRFGLVVLTRSTGGEWTAHRVYLQSDNLGCRYISVSKTQLNGYWWLTFVREVGWTSSVFWLARSADGLFWEAPLYTGIPANGHANLVGAMDGFTGQWVASDTALYQSEAHTFWSDQPVVRYDYTAGATTVRVAGGRAPHLTVVLDNRAGLAAPQLGARLTLERGFRIAGVDYYVSAGVYHVTGIRYLLDGNLLEVQGIDPLGLLTTFVADTAFNFANETVQSLVTAVCALAGVHAVSFDTHALWDEAVAAFTHPANENARVSLESLRERVPFDYLIEEDGTVAFYVPGAGPAATYTYGRGAGEHVYWPGEFGAQDAPNYVRVIGAPPRTVGGEAADETALASAGRPRTFFILDRRVTTTAAADALAAAWLLFFQERGRAGHFEAPPNFALEVGDVIAFAGAGYEAAAGPWRVEQIHELFNAPNARKFVQRIHLRGTA